MRRVAGDSSPLVGTRGKGNHLGSQVDIIERVHRMENPGVEDDASTNPTPVESVDEYAALGACNRTIPTLPVQRSFSGADGDGSDDIPVLCLMTTGVLMELRFFKNLHCISFQNWILQVRLNSAVLSLCLMTYQDWAK